MHAKYSQKRQANCYTVNAVQNWSWLSWSRPIGTPPLLVHTASLCPAVCVKDQWETSYVTVRPILSIFNIYNIHPYIACASCYGLHFAHTLASKHVYISVCLYQAQWACGQQPYCQWRLGEVFFGRASQSVPANISVWFQCKNRKTCQTHIITLQVFIISSTIQYIMPIGWLPFQCTLFLPVAGCLPLRNYILWISCLPCCVTFHICTDHMWSLVSAPSNTMSSPRCSASIPIVGQSLLIEHHSWVFFKATHTYQYYKWWSWLKALVCFCSFCCCSACLNANYNPFLRYSDLCLISGYCLSKSS